MARATLALHRKFCLASVASRLSPLHQNLKHHEKLDLPGPEIGKLGKHREVMKALAPGNSGRTPVVLVVQRRSPRSLPPWFEVHSRTLPGSSKDSCGLYYNA